MLDSTGRHLDAHSRQLIHLSLRPDMSGGRECDGNLLGRMLRSVCVSHSVDWKNRRDWTGRMTEARKLPYATYLSNRHLLVAYAARLLGSREAAEDVVQEAYIRFSQGLAQGGATVNPRAYLFRVVRNLAFNIRKRRLYEQRQLRQEVPDWGLPASLLSPEDSLHLRDSAKRLAQLVSNLPQNQRIALEMHRFRGRTMAEIALPLGLSERTAYRLVQTALATVSMGLREDLPAGATAQGRPAAGRNSLENRVVGR